MLLPVVHIGVSALSIVFILQDSYRRGRLGYGIIFSALSLISPFFLAVYMFFRPKHVGNISQQFCPKCGEVSRGKPVCPKCGNHLELDVSSR